MVTLSDMLVVASKMSSLTRRRHFLSGVRGSLPSIVDSEKEFRQKLKTDENYADSIQ